MTWNYRLVLMDIASPNDPWYEVCEVYYKKKKIVGWVKSPATIIGESEKDVDKLLKMIKKDIKRHAILKESELPK